MKTCNQTQLDLFAQFWSGHKWIMLIGCNVQVTLGESGLKSFIFEISPLQAILLTVCDIKECIIITERRP